MSVPWRQTAALALLAILASACTKENPLFDLSRIDGVAADAARPADAAWTDSPPPADLPPAAAPDLAPDIIPPVDLRANLVGYWKFDETAGMTAADSSNNGLGGTLESITAPACWAAGQYQNALHLPPETSGAGVRVGSTPALANLQRFTIAAWTYRTTFDDSRTMSVISRQRGIGDGEVFNLGMDRDAVRLWVESQGGSANVGASPVRNPLNRWVHLAATYDGAALTLFVDGAALASMPYTGGLATGESNPLYIGTNKNPTTYNTPWDGLLDDVLLYSVAHTPDTILSIAQGARPGL